MGPRSFDRGNPAGPSMNYSIELLQWGRDRSIAHIPQPASPPLLRLARFNGAALVRSGRVLVALACVWSSAGASIGPRSFDRGNTQTARNRATKYPGLQWGRDRSIAE